MHLTKKEDILFVGFIFIITTITAFGQISVSTGITGGLNYSTFGGSDVSNATTITQYAAGVFAEINFPLLPISIQPEVLYSMKGSKGPWIGIAPVFMNRVITLKYSYIDIPILLKYYLPTPVIKPFIFAGPSIGFLVSAKEEETTSPDWGGVNEVDVKNRTTSTDIGAVIGVGAKIPLFVVDLMLDARYYYGFTSADKINSSEIYNRVLSVYLGFVF